MSPSPKQKNPYGTPSRLLTPDHIFDTFEGVTPAWLSEHGIRALLIDIDNTLAPYEQDEPDERIRAWFAALSEAGITAALISNNHRERVDRFNRDLGLPAYPDAGKPKSRALLAAMNEMGSTPENTAGLGDQLLTDTLAVHRLGMVSIIVPPIRDKRTLFFRFKRLLERPFLRRYRRLQRKNERSRKESL